MKQVKPSRDFEMRVAPLPVAILPSPSVLPLLYITCEGSMVAKFLPSYQICHSPKAGGRKLRAPRRTFSSSEHYAGSQRYHEDLEKAHATSAAVQQILFFLLLVLAIARPSDLGLPDMGLSVEVVGANV